MRPAAQDLLLAPCLRFTKLANCAKVDAGDGLLLRAFLPRLVFLVHHFLHAQVFGLKVPAGNGQDLFAAAVSYKDVRVGRIG
jgi:hypothetical protein